VSIYTIITRQRLWSYGLTALYKSDYYYYYYIHDIIDKWQLSWQCDNLIFISHASVSFSITSVTSYMKSLMSQNLGIHHLHFATSDIWLQAFSDFTKVSWSPIIRSIRLLAAHATVASRHLYITNWAHCAVCAVFYLYPSPRRFAVNAIMWHSKTETENWFRPFPKLKPSFTEETRFWKPYCCSVCARQFQCTYT